MASQGSQIFSTMECYEWKKIHDKLIRIGVAHLTSMSTKQCDNRSFFVSSARYVSNLNDALFMFLNMILYIQTLYSHLGYFLLNNAMFICLFTYFFDNIT